MIPIDRIALFAQGACGNSSFFGIPPWYKYLDRVATPEPALGDSASVCTVRIDAISDVWLILAAVVEILLRIAMYLAIGFIIYGGIRYIISQGQPDKTAEAQHTLLNALIGLVIAVSAASIISFVAGRF